MSRRSNQETDSTALLESDSSNTAIIPETGQLTLEGFSLSVPADQMRVIDNINTLIAEVVFMDYLCEVISDFFLFFSCENQYSSSVTMLPFLNVDDNMRVILHLWLQLAIEKEELVQALSSELSRSAHVKVH